MREYKKIKYGCIILVICVFIGITAIAANGIYMATSEREHIGIEKKTEYADNYISNALTYDFKLLDLLSYKFINMDIYNNKDEIKSQMEGFVQETGISICIVDKSGTGYESNGDQINLNNYVDVNNLLSSADGVIHPTEDSGLKDGIVYLYTHVTNESNQEYLIFGWYTKEGLNERYDIDLFDEWNYYYIVDNDGTLILPAVETNDWGNLYDYINDDNALKKMMKNSVSYCKMFLCGIEEQVICTRQLNNINSWHIVSIVPQKYINHCAYQILLKVLIMCGCFTIIMIIIIYYIMKLIKRNAALAIKNESNACKSKFWSQMSHEIRTPMNAILGMAEIAKFSIDDKIKLEECLDNIENTSEYLLSVINDILDVTKLESNKVQLSIEPFKISEIIDTVKIVSASNINLKNIKMCIIKSGDINEIVCGDQNRIKQILVNLIGNATKFTDVNGKIKFCIKSEKISENTIKYIFEVTDSGIGIKKENLDKIFDPFEQGDSHVSARYGGSGLGLAICKGYLKLMDGNITVDSEYGKGTSFYVEVELKIADEAEKEMYIARINDEESNHIVQMNSIESTSENKKCILLADDNDMNLVVTTTMLEYYGYNVVVAHNGQEAIDLFENSRINQFDAILMDVQMPVKNGIDAATEIRTLNRSDALNIKIIALTANAFKEDIILTEKAGMNMHITKPVKMKDLQNKLNELFSEH